MARPPVQVLDGLPVSAVSIAILAGFRQPPFAGWAQSWDFFELNSLGWPACQPGGLPAYCATQSTGSIRMIRDERGLPLSTDSADAAALFDRAVEHYLKFHADTPALVGRMLAADPDFVLGHCFKGYLLLSASNPAFASRDRRDAGGGRSRPRRRTANASGCMSPRSPPGREARSTAPSRSGARSSTHIADRSAGRAHLRHDLVPPRPDRENPRTGRPARAALVARTARLRSVPHDLGLRARGGGRHAGRRARRRSRDRTGPHELFRARTSRRMCWRWNAGRARAASGSRTRPRIGRAATSWSIICGGTAR